jgi:hypothetical protein
MKTILTYTTVIMVLVMLLMLFRYLRNSRLQGLSVRPVSLRVPITNNFVISPAQGDRDAAYWAEMNDWHVTSQADDRRPMNGSVPDSKGSASANRSTARLFHQGMYKKWSQERHD